MRSAHVFNQAGRFESDALPAVCFRRFPGAQLFIQIRLPISSSGWKWFVDGARQKQPTCTTCKARTSNWLTKM